MEIWQTICMATPVRGSTRTESVARKIHFFRLDGGIDDTGLRKTVDLQRALKTVNDLSFSSSSSGGRYVLSAEADLCTWVDEVGNTSKLRFAVVRRNALPQTEADGVLTDLELDQNAGLCETSHMCVFPEGIVGVEFNFYGPRASRFPYYLHRIVPSDCPDFSLEALLRQDVVAELARKRAVRKMTLHVRRSYIDVIRSADTSLGAALRAAENASNADCVGIYLEPEPYQRRNLADTILNFIRAMAGRSDLRDNTRTFKATVIDQKTGEADEIDLLKDELISEKKILKQHDRTRVLDSGDAYNKIAEAFDERREDLLAAASVSVAQAHDAL